MCVGVCVQIYYHVQSINTYVDTCICGRHQEASVLSRFSYVNEPRYKTAHSRQNGDLCYTMQINERQTRVSGLVTGVKKSNGHNRTEDKTPKRKDRHAYKDSDTKNKI